MSDEQRARGMRFRRATDRWMVLYCAGGCVFVCVVAARVALAGDGFVAAAVYTLPALMMMIATIGLMRQALQSRHNRRHGPAERVEVSAARGFPLGREVRAVPDGTRRGEAPPAQPLAGGSMAAESRSRSVRAVPPMGDPRG